MSSHAHLAAELHTQVTGISHTSIVSWPTITLPSDDDMDCTVDRDIQSATEMLLLKRGRGAGGGVLHIVITALPLLSAMHIADALVYL